MRIIGITGPSGSGKTLLSEYLCSCGVPTIDADALYHSMLTPPSPVLDALKRVFGEGIFLADGTLSRAELGKIVFSSAEALESLNRTVLPLVISRVREKIGEYQAQGFTTVAVDAPTLFESGFDAECYTVIAVISDRESRARRICERDGIARERAYARIDAQKDDSFYTERSDIVLSNNGTADEFLSVAREKLKYILSGEVRA